MTVVNFSNALPKAQSLAESIAHNPALQELNKTVWLFSLVEITHLLFLVLVGGATLVLALRTLGVSLGDASLADVESVTRAWLRVGTIGGTISGIFMSIATALTLVGNGAFFIKILALVAAVLFGFALARRLRGDKGAVQGALSAIGLLLLATSLWLFASTQALVPGAELLGFVLGLFLVLSFIGKLRAQPVEQADRTAKLLAIGTVASWLTVTIGARWIGFSA